MKRFITLVLIFALLLTGCSGEAPADSSEITGKSFVYENGGFSGIDGDNFVISIHNDGSWTYTEGKASSHFAPKEKCSWELKDDVLILTEKRYNDEEYINRFKVSNDCLIYQSDDSDNFIYTKLENGEKFKAE